MRAEIPVDSFLISDFAIGMDGLLNFYDKKLTEREENLLELTRNCLAEKISIIGIQPTVAQASSQLLSNFSNKGWHRGITVTATGFYAPQNRKIRAQSSVSNLFELFDDFEFEGLKVTNLEMETAGIYGLSNILGHKAISLNAILANRRTGIFSSNPDLIVDKLIRESLEIISNSLI